MLPLSQLLDRFKNLPNTEKIKKEKIIEIFNKENIPITIKQIFLSKKTIVVKTKPIIKTEILLRKEKLLEQIKKTFNEDVFLEIK